MSGYFVSGIKKGNKNKTYFYAEPNKDFNLREAKWKKKILERAGYREVQIREAK